MAIGDEPKPNIPLPGNKKEGKEKINLRILLADDTASIRKVITSILGSKYSSVESVEDGAQLVNKLLGSDQNFDFIITDFNMPNMTGLKALEKIRATESWKNIPVILLTGEGGPDFEMIKKKVEELGGACMQKPFDNDVLFEMIESMRPKSA